MKKLKYLFFRIISAIKYSYLKYNYTIVSARQLIDFLFTCGLPFENKNEVVNLAVSYGYSKKFVNKIYDTLVRKHYYLKIFDWKENSRMYRFRVVLNNIHDTDYPVGLLRYYNLRKNNIWFLNN